MCGIAGVVDAGRPIHRELIEAMCEAMTHRGPDSRGVHVEDGAGLGAQRLAIIDVEGGSQPMTDESGDVVVVFNGEIYNHPELRRDLQARGHRFKSAADTEVIAHLYEEHGPDLVSRLEGMFAFAVWDRPRRRLVCARDRAGEKPLFWALRDRRFTFASELRALLHDDTIPRRANARAIDAYLCLGYVPDPLCAVSEVHKLAPASTLVLESGTVRIDRYWSLGYRPKRVSGDRRALEEELRLRLDEATRSRMRSDVPLGALLSGGLDSSAVVAAMAAHSSRPVRTFSIGFDDSEHDESSFARLVAERLGTDHHELRVRPDAAAILPRMARHHGEPFGDSSAIPSFHLAELASRHVKVVLTGDGGDESFAGYDRYVPTSRLAQIARLPRALRAPVAPVLRLAGEGRTSRSPRSRLSRLGRLLAMDRAGLYANAMTVFGAAERDALLAPGFLPSPPGPPAEERIAGPWRAVDSDCEVERMLGADVATYLPGDLLVKMDIATMAHSVEARAPFLDHRLMEFAAGLPAGVKLGPRGGKEILRSALRDVLPGEILERPKMGFAAPLGRWLREELVDLPGEVLLDPGARTAGYVRRSAVERLLGEHADGVTDHSARLWSLLALETWHREVLDPPPGGPARGD